MQTEPRALAPLVSPAPLPHRPPNDGRQLSARLRAGSLVADGLVPGGLMLLSVVPVVAAGVRLVELAGGAELTPDNARFFAAPLPAVTHMVSGSLFFVGGAFQFSPALRRRGRSWHRMAGRLLAPLGIVAALSALWLTAFYPPTETTSALLQGFRAMAATAMIASLSLGLLAVSRRRFVAHGEWMIRGYALGIAGGTQVFTYLPWIFFFGEPGALPYAVLMGAGWALNLFVAELVIRGRRRRRACAPAIAKHTTSKMRAVRFRRYGGPDVIELVDVDVPTPGAGQVLVRVHAASINAADYRVMRADPFLVRLAFGLLRPKTGRLGSDLAGVVVAVGAAVEGVKVGDEVFGECSHDGLGAFAEYVAVRASALAKKPAALSFKEAAAVPLAAVTALQAVRDRAQIAPGHKVLIQGAGGGVGTFLVQLAKARGAHVTAICGPRSAELLGSLGADRVIDYTVDAFEQRGERYDVIFGVNGYRTLGEYLARLNPGGLYLMIGGTTRQLFDAILFGALRSRRDRRIGVLTLDDTIHRRDLEELSALLDDKVVRPVIDRACAFADTQQALRYVEGGHVPGKVIIEMFPTGRQAALP